MNNNLTIIDLIKRNLDESRGMFFLENNKYISYKEIYERALKVMRALQKEGIKRGDEVIFQLGQNEDFITCFWGCLLGGMIPVPIPVAVNDEGKSKLLKVWGILNRPKLITEKRVIESIASIENTEIKKALRIIKENTYFMDKINKTVEESDEIGKEEEIKSSDIALIQFSSGSTGDPKGVIIKHENIVSNNLASIKRFDCTNKDSMLSWMPLTHDMGLIALHIIPFVVKMNQYIMPTMDFLKSPLDWMECISKNKITLTAAPNFGYNHFLKFYNKQIDYHWDLSHVRAIFNGAEPVNFELCSEFCKELSKYSLNINRMKPSYGLAEATLIVTMPTKEEKFAPLKVNRRKLNIGDKIDLIEGTQGISIVALGSALSDCALRICDKANRILTEGYVGEIQVKGASVTSGYYNNIDKTKELFTSDEWLKTGDIGFVYKNSLFITGREKEIIFINGQNYYPMDIEKVITKLNYIDVGKVCVCGVVNRELNKEEVVAFLIYDSSLEGFCRIAQEVKELVNREINIELKNVIPVKEFLKTASGKVQRYKLGELYKKGEFNNILSNIEEIKESERFYAELVEPRDEVEKELLKIWQEVLNLKNISVNKSFFELGGDSLKATYLIHNINCIFNVDIEVRDVFQKNTIEKIGEYIKNLEVVKTKSIEIQEPRKEYPLYSPQSRIYAVNTYKKSTKAYNMSQAIEITGDLNLDKLKSVFNTIVCRHEALRTEFHYADGEVVQKIAEIEEFKVDYEDLSKKELKEEEINALINGFIRPFDLSKAPLIRCKLLKIHEKRFILILDMHHIISDGTSLGVIFQEAISLYKGLGLKPVKVQYKDYILWQKDNVEEKYNEMKEYWLRKFSKEITTLNLPVDYTRPSLQSFNGETISFKLERTVVRKIKKALRETETSLYMILLSAYNILLSKYANEEDIIVGTAIAGRNHRDIEKTVGMFVNTVVMRTNVEKDKTFSDYLLDVKNETIGLLENQYYPLEALIKDLDIKREMSRNPLFDTMFVLENMAIPEGDLGEIKFKNLHYKNKISKFDVTLFAMESKEEILFDFEYCTSLFKKETIERACNHYVNILKEIVENINVKIKDICILDRSEKNRILNELNNTEKLYNKEITINEMFEDQVRKTPSKIAVEGEGYAMTYEELNKEANKIAHTLVNMGVGAEDKVALILPRSKEFVVSIIGVLKSGAAYIPIDLSYPKERIDYILGDCEAKLVIMLEENKDLIGGGNNVLFIDKEELISKNQSSIPIRNNENSLVYIIYTSGSTGKPKGVMIEQKNLINYITWAIKNYMKNENDVFPLFTTVSFDLTVTSIFTPLLSGNKMRIYSDDSRKLAIEKVLEDNQCTVVKLTPAHLKLIKDMDNSKSKIRRFIVGGEELESSLAKAIHDSFEGKVEICNEYGPTEATVGCMIHVYDYEKDKKKGVPIGRPADNVSLYILDKNLNPCAYNVIGEMYIGGHGIARGYINREKITEERFFESPFKKGEKIYKTGDLGRWLSNGIMEYYGRIDNQTKIRGYRIEIGEIQNELLSHSRIKDGVIVINEDAQGEKSLYAYIVEKEKVEIKDLRMYLQRKLPEYMIPAKFIKVNAIPLTPNGKVDKEYLREHYDYIASTEEYVAATTDDESVMAQVWSDVLGIKEVGIKDNYFALGGDSIKAIQIISKLRDKGININVKDILVYQTIEDIILNVDIREETKEYEQSIIDGEVPLTPIQRWFLNNLKYKNHYNQSVCLKVKESIDIDILEKAMKTLITNHDGLRLNYNKESNQMYYNNNHLSNKFKIETIDLSSQGNNVLKDIKKIGENLKSSIDIESGVLIKLEYIKLEEEELLLITAHHLIIDGVSWRILLEDMVNAYYAFKNGKSVNLPMKTASLLDWSTCIEEYSRNDKIYVEEKYWQSIEGQKFVLPVEFHGNIIEKDRVKILGCIPHKETEQLLKECNRAFNTEINDLLLTALYVTINQWISNKSIKVQLESHGRNLDGIDLSRTIGWFTSLYPVILKSNSDALENNIKDIKETLRKTPNNGIGYGILKYLKGTLHREESQEIRFNYLGSFKNEFNNELFMYKSVDTGSEISENNPMTCKLEINSFIIEDEFNIEFSYSSKNYKREVIEKVRDNYIDNLRKIIKLTSESKKRSFTPSDFTLCDFTIESLDSIFEKEPHVKCENVKDILPLTNAQKGIIEFICSNKKTKKYFAQMSYNLNREIDYDTFKKAWQFVVDNNDILRTIFTCEDTKIPYQIVLKELKANIRFCDLSENNELTLEERLESIKKNDIEEEIKLNRPIFRVTLCKLGQSNYEMIVSNHHILCDGWSNSILLKEFKEAYVEISNEHKLKTKNKTGLKDFIIKTSKNNKEREKEFWSKYLYNYKNDSRMPLKNYNGLEGEGKSYIELVDGSISEKVELYCKENRVTKAAFFYICWAVLLKEYCNINDVVLGTTTSGRKVNINRVDEIVGVCKNMIPVRVVFNERNIHELVKEVDNHLKDREEFENTSVSEIEKYGNITKGKRLMHYNIIIENYPADKEGIMEELRIKGYDIFEYMNEDLTLQIIPFMGLELKFIYEDSKFSNEDVQAIAKDYCEIIKKII